MSAAELTSSIGGWLRKTKPPGLTEKLLKAHLHNGTALVIFDGADEIPLSRVEDQRESFPRAMFLDGFRGWISNWNVGNRAILTSRPYGLADADRTLNARVAPIEELPKPMQELLVRRWFHFLSGDADQAKGTAGEMLGHVRQRSDLAELMANALLLTALCIIYSEGKRLPQHKYDLYDRIADTVLYNRYPDPSAIELARARLSVVAYGMHTGEGLDEDRKTPQPRATFKEIDRMLQKFRDVSSWAERAIREIEDIRGDLLSHTGFLLPQGEKKAGFYHFSVQEFLAAERLLDLESGDLLETFRTRSEVADWRNTLSFVFGSLLAGSASKERATRFLNRLIDSCEPGQGFALPVVVAECIQILLGQNLLLLPARAERFRRVCIEAIEREAPLPERHRLGLALGRIGDPRIAADLRTINDSAYAAVDAGDYSAEEPKRTFRLEAPLWFSRYPVTNSQFALFVADGGYKNTKKYWSKEGRSWIEREKVSEPRYWKDPRWNGLNQPVVGVSFFEAEAFCAWAGGRLPDEFEWEAAARGPEGSEYPWGSDWKDGICNTQESGLGMTSSVGLFPASRSVPFGLEDMAGNVKEWCSSTDARRFLEEARVVRGGSWNFDAGLALASYHVRGKPGLRHFGVGIRVVRVRTP